MSLPVGQDGAQNYKNAPDSNSFQGSFLFCQKGSVEKCPTGSAPRALGDQTRAAFPPIPELEHGGYYAFLAINRLSEMQGSKTGPSNSDGTQFTHPPFVDGGLSTTFTVYPLALPDEPIITSVESVTEDAIHHHEGWYSIDGRYLGLQKPTDKGLYIHNGKKLVIVK